MAIHRATLLFSLLAVSLILTVHSTTTTPSTNAPDFIRTSCNSTLYADVCYATLSPYAEVVNQSEAQLAKLAISVAISNTRAVTTYISALSNRGAVFEDCAATLSDAVDQMRNSVRQMRRLGGAAGKNGGVESVKFQMSNVQTWMSAALTNVGTCVDGIEEAGDGSTDVRDRVAYVKTVTSNALALVNLYVNKSV